MCLVVDKVGSNISQQGNRHIAGKKYCHENGFSVPQNKLSINNKHYTLMGFKAFTGQPVMCVVIFSGILQSYEVEVGIDIDALVICETTDKAFFEKKQGKLFPTGPECAFNEKKYQLWFVGHHPEVSPLICLLTISQRLIITVYLKDPLD